MSTMRPIRAIATTLLGEEPHAELSNHLHEGLDHDDRGDQHVDHDPELPAAVVGAEDDIQEAGMPPTMPTRRPAGVSVSSSPRP
jgi:hypothetical protein